ncbi:MAG TPA: hypothetical protein VLJ76_03185 [Gaiellaceae bacterium]|nr:hypothetical protein [Gaiellaceae bacterium]
MSSVLDRTGHVGAGYVHIPKLARPGSILALGEATLKWYEIAPEDSPVPLGVRELAYEALCRGARSGELELSGDLGFVILHRCGQSFYFLIVSSWRNDNELWETVWAKTGPEDPGFEPWPTEGPHRPTYCVWELGAVCHERRAWSRYLRSVRDSSARQEYLLDAFAGEV